MRIGVDAKSFFTGPVSTRIILQNLLPHVFDLFPQHEWVIFLDKKDRSKVFPYIKKNIILDYVWADNNLLSNLFILPRLVRKHKVDVMFYQTFPPLVKKVPSIAFIHDVLFRRFPQFFTWKEKLYFKPLKVLARNATRLIATSEYVADELLYHGYTDKRSKIDLMPLGVSPDFKPIDQHPVEMIEEVRKKYHLPEKFILYAGRLNVRKNIEALLKAMPLLVDKNIALVIVGKEDWKTTDLQQLSQKLNTSHQIIFTGEISNEELAIIYALAKVFCFPSFAEGFGLPPIEAMASGVPVVVSRTTATAEICGDAATYIDPYQHITIAHAINDLLSDKEKYLKMKVSGIEHARKFTWHNTAKAFVASINKAVHSPDS